MEKIELMNFRGLTTDRAYMFYVSATEYRFNKNKEFIRQFLSHKMLFDPVSDADWLRDMLQKFEIFDPDLLRCRSLIFSFSFMKFMTLDEGYPKTGFVFVSHLPTWAVC